MAESLQLILPESTITVVDDHANVPYGNKSESEIINLTDSAIQPLLSGENDVIVIACNTATTVAVDSLRLKYPGQKFVGLEPMIKPAALLTKSGCIAVCATKRTLNSKRYSELKRRWANNLEVIEPDCSDWASLIETGRQDEIDIKSVIDYLISRDVDVIVLGCTHYHWVKDDIAELAGDKIKILEPTDAIAERITNITSSNC